MEKFAYEMTYVIAKCPECGATDHISLHSVQYETGGYTNAFGDERPLHIYKYTLYCNTCDHAHAESYEDAQQAILSWMQ